MQRGQKRTNHELSLGKSSFHNRRGGNTIRDMFSFCQLWGWMLRFGVTHTHTQTLGASVPSFPIRTTPPPPGNYSFLPRSSCCHFLLYLRSCFTPSCVKRHKSSLSTLKPSLGKQWRGNSPLCTHTEKSFRNLKSARL